jgi:hypothetical protein
VSLILFLIRKLNNENSKKSHCRSIGCKNLDFQRGKAPNLNEKKIHVVFTKMLLLLSGKKICKIGCMVPVEIPRLEPLTSSFGTPFM